MPWILGLCKSLGKINFLSEQSWLTWGWTLIEIKVLNLRQPQLSASYDKSTAALQNQPPPPHSCPPPSHFWSKFPIPPLQPFLKNLIPPLWRGERNGGLDYGNNDWMYVSSKRLKRNYRKLDCPKYNCRTSKNNAKTWNKNTFVLHYIRKFIDKNIQEHCK